MPPTGPTYGRLLAFNDRGRQYLKRKRASIPIVKNGLLFAKVQQSTTKVLCEQDQLASKLTSELTVDNPNYRGSHYDFTTSPICIKPKSPCTKCITALSTRGTFLLQPFWRIRSSYHLQ